MRPPIDDRLWIYANSQQNTCAERLNQKPECVDILLGFSPVGHTASRREVDRARRMRDHSTGEWEPFSGVCQRDCTSRALPNLGQDYCRVSVKSRRRFTPLVNFECGPVQQRSRPPSMPKIRGISCRKGPGPTRAGGVSVVSLSVNRVSFEGPISGLARSGLRLPIFQPRLWIS